MPAEGRSPVGGRRRWSAMVALAAAAALVLGACGIKDDASVAAGDFCDQARALGETGPELPESPEAIEQVADQFDRLADSAPAEIEDDMAFLADVYRQVTDALAESGGDDPADIFAAAAPFFDPENAERLEEANQNIERYLSEECGIDVDDDTSTTLAGGDTSTTSTTAAATTSTTEEETTTTTDSDASTTSTTTDDGGDDALPPGQPPGNLGDDPALDELAQQCFEGDMQACDDLFFQSPIDSAYEDYGDSCGGRNEPMGLCTDIYDQD